MSEYVNELFSVQGRTALVTGGSRGIGRMIAEGLVRAGVTVFVTSRKADACAAAAKEMSQYGACEAIPGDLSQPDDRRRVVAELGRRVESLDILVNNAGANWGARIADTEDAALEKVLALNVKAVFSLTRDLLPLMSASATSDSPARVINIGSIAGFVVPAENAAIYAASKAAVHHLTRNMAKALAPTITVNALAPGPFDSKMMSDMPSGFRDEIVALTPMKRAGRHSDVAGAVIFLASAAGTYVNGAVLPVDGGLALVGG